MATRILGLILACGMVTQIADRGATYADSKSVLVRIADVETSLKPTAGPSSVSNCLIVYETGRLHLELRRQEFFRGNASLATYKAVLPQNDLVSLHSMLDSAAVRKLPDTRKPKLPLSSDHFGWFAAEIHEAGAIHKVGYPFWDGELKPSEDESVVWEAQRAALQPLVEWSRLIKRDNYVSWRKVRNTNSVCQP